MSQETLLQRCQREAREKMVSELTARSDGKKPQLGGTSLWNVNAILLCDNLVAHILKQAAEALEETLRLGVKPKPYDGNDLQTANDYYHIAAQDWSEVIRYESGYDSALTDAQRLLGEDNG